MKLEDFNLRDKKFRDYIFLHVSNSLCIGSHSNWHDVKQNILSILAQEKITDNELVKFYFAINNYDPHFNAMLFNYKMREISAKRLAEFIKIIKMNYPLLNVENEISFYNLSDKVMELQGVNLLNFHETFNKLIDIFLDEI